MGQGHEIQIEFRETSNDRWPSSEFWCKLNSCRKQIRPHPAVLVQVGLRSLDPFCEQALQEPLIARYSNVKDSGSSLHFMGLRDSVSW